MARRIEAGIDAALEVRERFQALLVPEWQQLHKDHAGDVARRIDPVVGIGEASPGEAAGRLGALAAAEVIQHIGARPQVSLKELAQQNGLPV